MRILVVSAHYPPNFVSGGTLVPQRLARGLRARGHEVTVYAGWLGDERRPLETWDEVDESGLRVRWIATTPFMAWNDRRNFDNPEVTEDFAGFVADFRPDLVHAHSLQTMGAGVVDPARRAGARVVVTMHDFWWVCARQFLVDRSYQPCPLVVDAGNCPCEVDHRWLEQRNEWLRDRLSAVDLVLAPSSPAAAVMAANGVDPSRLEVDENGFPDELLPARSAHENEPATEPEVPGPLNPLRLVYAGGSNRMKGVHVLLAAARRLGDRQGWRLRAHGIDQYLEDDPGAVADLPVEARPPFEPGAVDEVFAETDVLVVPSVMRETHSLLTREALARGVPVVCTDCIGPEEVVADGVNGLVVATADHRALAGAIERVLDEPGLLRRLRAGCQGVQLRALDEQVVELESRYERLLARPPAAAPPRRNVRRVVFLVGIEGAPLRYRAWLPAEGLALTGVESELYHYRDERAREAVERADALVVYRVPATPQVLAFVGAARERGTPAFFDVDDLIFDPDLAPEIPALRLLPADEAALWMQGVRRYRTTMEACDGFIGSTAVLCDHATELTGLPSFRFENGVGVGVGRASMQALGRPRTPGPARIGYLSGTTTHDEDWAMIEPVVASVLRRLPDVELWVSEHTRPGAGLDRYADRIRTIPFLPWTELPTVLRDLDVNLAPLTAESRFNEAKSAIKWLEAALVMTPTIASPTAPFREAVTHGRTGILATGPAEWEDSIIRLVADSRERDDLGRRAHRAALLRWSPRLQGRRYLAILSGELPPRGRAAPWDAVTVDEPFTRASESVDVRAPGVAAGPSWTVPAVGDGSGVPSPTALSRLRSIGRRGAAQYRASGSMGAARAAGRFARRQARARLDRG